MAKLARPRMVNQGRRLNAAAFSFRAITWILNYCGRLHRRSAVASRLRWFHGGRGTWRNEANWWCKGLSCHRGYRFGNWCVGLGGPIDRPGRRLGLGGLGVLEVLEDFEGTEIHAVSRINAPLNAGKGIESGMESVAEGGIVLDGGVDEIGVGEILVEALDLVIPELGFDAAQAALGPLGGDEGVDERELDGAGRAVVEEKCG